MNRLIISLCLSASIAAFSMPTLVSAQEESLAQEEKLPNVNSPLGAQQSTNGLFTLMLEPSLKPMRLNKLHYWKLQLRDADNKIVIGASIAVDGGMPGHGHGLPTSPKVIPAKTPGHYLLRGLRFNMGGVWELKLNVQDGDVNDQVEFRFVVTDSTGS